MKDDIQSLITERCSNRFLKTCSLEGLDIYVSHVTFVMFRKSSVSTSEKKHLFSLFLQRAASFLRPCSPCSERWLAVLVVLSGLYKRVGWYRS